MAEISSLVRSPEATPNPRVYFFPPPPEIQHSVFGAQRQLGIANKPPHVVPSFLRDVQVFARLWT